MINNYLEMIDAITSAIKISFKDLDSDRRAIKREYDFTMRLFMILYTKFPHKIMNADNAFKVGNKQFQSDITILNKHSNKITHIIEVKLGTLYNSMKDANKAYGKEREADKAAKWLICLKTGSEKIERKTEEMAMMFTKKDHHLVIIYASYQKNVSCQKKEITVYKTGKMKRIL